MPRLGWQLAMLATGLCPITAFAIASADISVVTTGPATVTAGTNAAYSITVANNGPSDAAAESLSDTVPSGTTVVSFVQNSGPANGGTLPSGGTETFTLTLHINPNVANGATLTNTANVSSTTFDPATGNNSFAFDSTAATQADISVLTTGPASVAPGTNATYFITVTNHGPSDAANVNLSDTLPTNTSLVSFVQGNGPPLGGTLPLNGVQTFTLVVHLNTSATDGTILTNTANVTSTTSDPNSGNNSSALNSTVVSQADLTIFTNGPTTATAGATITYLIAIINGGPNDAQGVGVTDVLPANTTFLSFVQDSGPGVGSPLPVGGVETFKLLLRLNASAPPGSTSFNTARTRATTSDPHAADNSVIDPLTVASDGIFADGFE